ncbi:MAG: lipid II flippase MurJ, partial [bacterium]|nr:lipid II flippase MurJ [bacterium]
TIIRFLLPGVIPEHFTEAADAVRVVGSMLPLAGISAVLSTALASSGKQRVPILARALPALAVGLAVFLIKISNLATLPLALLVGTAARFGILLMALLSAKISFKRPRPLWKGGRVLLIFIGLPLIVFVLRNLHIVTERVLASTALGSSGTVVSIVLAFLPLTPFLGMVGSVTTIVLLPFIMRSGLAGGKEQIARLMSLGLQLTLALSVPTTAFLLTFKSEITEVLYGWGAIRVEQQVIICSLLARYAPGIVALAVLPVLLRVMQITRSVLFQMSTAVGGFIVTFGLQWILLCRYGHQGIPTGTVLGAYLLGGFLFIFLIVDLGRESHRDIPGFLGALLFSSVISAWVASKVFEWLFGWMELLWFPLISAGFIFSAGFCIILAALTWSRIMNLMSAVMGKTPVD